MKRALITGGAGFIGSHLTEQLLEREVEVYCIDDLSTGSIENIEIFKNTGKFHYVVDTIMNEPLLAELVDMCDIVYHLAAAVGVKLIVESPVRTLETNIRGTEAVLKMANKKKKKVLLTSTSEVYGKSDQVPFSEEHDMVLGPTSKSRWSYACSKAIDEFLALAYWKERKLPTVVARLFNTVGPRQTGQYGMVIPTFVKQALSGRPITVYGDGEQTRSFSYVTDVVDAIIKISEHPEAVGQIFNIGADEEISILDLAHLVREITQSKSDILLIPYDEAYEKGFEDMRKRIPDIRKVRDLVGFQPKVELKEMIQRVTDYFVSKNAF